jgi:hypothetical protein
MKKNNKERLYEMMYRVGKMPINENNINEIDWDQFGDVKKECMTPEALAEYLNKVRANAPLDTADREKFSKTLPFIHAKSSFFDKDTLDVNVDEFIERMTQKPNFIVGTNDKIFKSGKENQFVFKTGIPAFRGLVYDKKNDKFYVINTCPGAGSCVNICYALKGNFIRYPGSYDNMTRVLNLLLNEPEEYEAQLYNELEKTAKKYKAFGDSPNEIVIRWNDSGDFFTKKYVEIANKVKSELVEKGYNIEDYAYTKVADVANDAELIGSVKYSSGASEKEASKIKSKTQQKSIVVPQDLFKDINIKNEDDLEILKDRILNDEKINSESNIPLKRDEILTYKELMKTPLADESKWSVIIRPGDGDDAGLRRDVQNVLLTIH